MDTARISTGSWTDTANGVREEVQFVGRPGRRIFGCTHLPLSVVMGGVLICSPLHAEFQTNYRREVLLARALAARGIVVQRFHYRGTGHSEGESGAVTFGSMLEDAATALERLRSMSAVPRVGFLGTRFGSLVAASVAASLDGAPIAMWEPVIHGDRYFKDILRASLVHRLKEGAADGHSSETLVDELRRTGTADVVGYSVHRELLDSSVDRTLAEFFADGARAVLILQLGTRDQLRREFRDLSVDLVARGHSVETRLVPAKETWWFSNEPTRAAPLSKRVVDATSDWFVTVLAEDRGLG